MLKQFSILALMISSSYSKKVYCHYHNNNQHKGLFEELEDLTIFLTNGNKNYVYFEEETLSEHKDKSLPETLQTSEIVALVDREIKYRLNDICFLIYISITDHLYH